MRSNNFKLRDVRSKYWLMMAMIPVLAGCISPWWNGFLTPHEVGNFRDNRVNEIQRAISFRDKPLGIAGAVDPTPEDLVASVEEYTIGAGDQLSIRLLDFFQLNMESEIQPVVDELGYIDVPQIGWLHVEGMTLRQLQSEIVQQAKTAGIYPADSNPTVVVQTLLRQQRVYNISGAIASPGPYAIVRPDFRLREAINQTGGLDLNVRMIYVFRNEPRQKKLKGMSESPTASSANTQPEPAVRPSGPTAASTAPASPPPAPPVMPMAMAEMNNLGGPAAKPVARPKDEVERDLQEAITPAGTSGPAGGRNQQSTMPTYIYVNDSFVEAPQPASQSTSTSSAQAVTTPPTALTAPTSQEQAAGPKVNWEELASEGQQRVIRIPAEKIKNGDPNYNVVIKHQDWIELDAGSIGFYYILGHVLRPGVYDLRGQEITLTQAIAAAGGLDQIAWPSRCEVRRRLDGDREEITQWDLSRIIDGQDPDLFIKKEDVINVGTHAVAPLLATIRNAFRLTYGFGFVYDRNFADLDAFNPQVNPTDRHRTERQNLGLRR